MSAPWLSARFLRPRAPSRLRRSEEVHARGIIRADTSVSGRRSKDKVDEVNSTNTRCATVPSTESKSSINSILVNPSTLALSPQAQHHSSMCRLRNLSVKFCMEDFDTHTTRLLALEVPGWELQSRHRHRQAEWTPVLLPEEPHVK